MIPESMLEDLKRRAMAASQNAYCPYSNFRVGAAVLTDHGEMFSGCNVENAAFGLTICAERNAIFQAVANGAKGVRAVVIYTPTAVPNTPCGSCRQVIREFGVDAEILCFCDGEGSARYELSELLPQSFGPENLR